MIALITFVLLAMCTAIVPNASAQGWHSMVFREDAPGIDENPLKGFIPYSSTRQGAGTFPHSMEWFYLPLSEVVVAENTYDWRPLNKQLTAIARRGHQAVFRFYLDYPEKPSGVPHYLLAAGLKTFPYDDFGNAKSPTRSVAPDYSDPRLIDCMIHFIRALGAKYDGDARIAYVTAGLFGFWGEWRVANHPAAGEDQGWSMSQKNKDSLLAEYRGSFHKTMVLVRYPWVSESRDVLADFGFHDDSFLRDTTGVEDWQFWRGMQKAGLTESWQIRPVGGEIYPQLQRGLWDTWPNRAGQDVGAAIATTHATWMMDDDLFHKTPTRTGRTNALRAQRMLGYTLFCSAVRLVRLPEGPVSISIRLENRGVAPLYAAWPIEFEALDRGKHRVARANAAWPVATLLPGRTAEWSARLDAPDRAKTIVLRIANPLPNGHPVAFANAEMGTLLPGWLTLGEFATAPQGDLPHLTHP